MKLNLQWVKDRCRIDGDCWVWSMAVGARNQHPRYTFRVGSGKTESRQVRRIAWEAANGPIPDKMRVSVNCGCERCCNPKHLELNSPSTINARTANRPEVRARRFVAALPTRMRAAKLDTEKARYIRESDRPALHLARELGVSETLVCQVRRGERWRESHMVASPFAGLGARP